MAVMTPQDQLAVATTCFYLRLTKQLPSVPQMLFPGFVFKSNMRDKGSAAADLAYVSNSWTAKTLEINKQLECPRKGYISLQWQSRTRKATNNKNKNARLWLLLMNPRHALHANWLCYQCEKTKLRTSNDPAEVLKVWPNLTMNVRLKNLTRFIVQMATEMKTNKTIRRFSLYKWQRK
eukprot:874200-Pelagomonas_calceolata.AAC.1